MDVATPNRFAGRIKAIVLANVMAEVEIESSTGTILAVLPRSVLTQMNLEVGSSVVALVNPADVMLAKP